MDGVTKCCAFDIVYLGVVPCSAFKINDTTVLGFEFHLEF